MKSTVFAILALSSAKVSSVSSCLGTSTPARRATAPLAVSQAICTWRFIGNMSGKSRQWVKTVGSIFFASAWAWALPRIAERFLSALTKRGVLASYMEMIIGAFWYWAMRARRATSPTGKHGHALAVADKCHETHLVERRLRRHQHLHNSQHHRPHEQIQLRFHRSSLLSDCGRYGTPISAGIVAARSRGRSCGLGAS